MKKRRFKKIWGQPWDYEYLLSLEQRKLREMAKYFKSDKCWAMDGHLHARDCELCVKLIDIILEQDLKTKKWYTSVYQKETEDVPFSKYINIKNQHRFGFDCSITTVLKYKEILKIELRKKKAFALYQKIRLYRMMKWFD